MKKLLIFDAYGTLLSTGSGSVDAVRKILALQPQAIDPAAFYARWKHLHRRHMDICNQGDFLPEEELFALDLAALYEEYRIRRPYREDVLFMLQSLTGRAVFPDAAEALPRLMATHRVVIGSTTDTQPLLKNLADNALHPHAVYTSEGIRKYKPAPEFYRHILRREGVAPGDALFIGDSLRDDVLGPQQVGIATVWVNRRNVPLRPTDPQPDHIVHSIKEIAELPL